MDRWPPGCRSNKKRACPARGLADFFSSTRSRPPCIRWTTNVTDSNSSEEELAASRDDLQRMPVGLLGSRHDGLQRGERERAELLQAQPAELLGEPLGVGLDFGHLRHGQLVPDHSYSVCALTAANTESSAPNSDCESSSRCWSPCSRMCPLTNASWALSVPVATATAVSQDSSMRNVFRIGRPGGEGDLAVADLEVVGDVALRAVGDDLGEADLVRWRHLLEPIAGRDRRGNGVDPVEAEVAHERSLPE